MGHRKKYIGRRHTKRGDLSSSLTIPGKARAQLPPHRNHHKFRDAPLPNEDNSSLFLLSFTLKPPTPMPHTNRRLVNLVTFQKGQSETGAPELQQWKSTAPMSLRGQGSYVSHFS